MPRRNYLGELELVLLLALIRLGDEAYGVPIARELEHQARRSVSLGSVYATLERLEERGLVKSRIGEPTAERGAARSGTSQSQRRGCGKSAKPSELSCASGRPSLS